VESVFRLLEILIAYAKSIALKKVTFGFLNTTSTQISIPGDLNSLQELLEMGKPKKGTVKNE